ncbi:ImmA/IrrE family metallo-endopeptidase [Maribacter sp. 4U21]|uniref:ImmA/IrrE family metallo-endopeptidase n=1 Tax=Maribacter sp. 4U21 TaxID=1889779 RepID=UPI000C150F63|nr:ImmA/IrrE family metallo-endopeptidase [Maribacter sp. 4U21]
MTSFSGTVGGNTHRPISREEFRGFALVDNYAPFIFINSNDAKAAQLFTLIHELAHIWPVVSSGTDMYNLLPANNPLEKLCDRVAAEFLVPASIFAEQWSTTKNFNVLRRFFKVSTLVLARRALDLELISKSDYLEHYNQVIGFWRSKKDDSENGGGHYYYTTRRRVGAQFARYVDSAVKRDKLLYRDAYQLMNLKGSSYNRLMTEFL